MRGGEEGVLLSWPGEGGVGRERGYPCSGQGSEGGIEGRGYSGMSLSFNNWWPIRASD